MTVEIMSHNSLNERQKHGFDPRDIDYLSVGD